MSRLTSHGKNPAEITLLLIRKYLKRVHSFKKISLFDATCFDIAPHDDIFILRKNALFLRNSEPPP